MLAALLRLIRVLAELDLERAELISGTVTP